MTIYCFDLDGTLCSQFSPDYSTAVPFPERIKVVNQLRSQGHVIKIFTARGSKSGIDWSDRTRDQLNAWGLEFDELILGKPHADFYVDDKSVHPDQFEW